MKKSEIITVVTSLAEQAAAAAGVELVDIEYVKESGRYFLRVYIDKPNGVTVDDCHQVHIRMDQLLDEVDPIDHAYVLEVSSPGLDRPLKRIADYARNIGKRVNIKTYQLFEGMKQFEGTLTGVENDVIRLDLGVREIELPYDQIAKARLVVDF